MVLIRANRKNKQTNGWHNGLPQAALSGLETSKKKVLADTKKYVCGKVTRELVKGSIEVSPLPGYGAVELGSHMFHNNQEKDHIPHPAKFVIVWRNKNAKWTITKVISLH